MACPNYQAEVERLAAAHTEAWQNAHTGNPHTEDFVRIVAYELHAIDPNVGLNGKRGVPTDISDDALNVLDPEGPGSTPDGAHCWVVDFIVAAGSDDAHVGWNPLPDAVGSSGANVVPGPPPTNTGQVYPYPDEHTAGQAFQDRVHDTYEEAGRAFPDPADPNAFRHFMRYGYSAHEMPEPAAADKHIAELRADLGLPPASS